MRPSLRGQGPQGLSAQAAAMLPFSAPVRGKLGFWPGQWSCGSVSDAPGHPLVSTARVAATGTLAPAQTLGPEEPWAPHTLPSLCRRVCSGEGSGPFASRRLQLPPDPQDHPSEPGRIPSRHPGSPCSSCHFTAPSPGSWQGPPALEQVCFCVYYHTSRFS